MRGAAGRLHAAPASAGRGALVGGALPGARGAWCVLPPGERAITVSVDALALRVDLARAGRAPLELSLHRGAEGTWQTMSLPLDLSGTDLARAVTLTLDDLDPSPATLTVRCEDARALTVRCAPARNEGEPALCGYRACASDPVSFSAQCARRVDALLAVLADLGLRRAELTLSTRDGPPLRARIALHRGLAPETWTAALRALARGSVTSLSLGGVWGELLIAPATRGAVAVNETVLHLCLGMFPATREAGARAAVEDALATDPDALLQAWCAPVDAPLRPRCVTRWERGRGVRALPMARGWLGHFLRGDVPRAFIDGAWREGDLTAHHPNAQAWRAALALEGAAAGSSRVRALWRRTGGEPLQGGIA